MLFSNEERLTAASRMFTVSAKIRSGEDLSNEELKQTLFDAAIVDVLMVAEADPDFSSAVAMLTIQMIDAGYDIL